MRESSFSMLEDKLLIWKFNHGDIEALRDIYEKYKDDLVTLAAALLTDISPAEDVVHDVFVSFIRSSGKFRLTGSLRGYLATCVANGARNKNKAARKHGAIALDETEPAARDSNRPEARAIFGEELRQLAEALEQLPYEQREAIALRLHGNLRFRQIAKLQNVSTKTAQSRYRYGLDKLRSTMNGEVEK